MPFDRPPQFSSHSCEHQRKQYQLDISLKFGQDGLRYISLRNWPRAFATAAGIGLRLINTDRAKKPSGTLNITTSALIASDNGPNTKCGLRLLVALLGLWTADLTSTRVPTALAAPSVDGHSWILVSLRVWASASACITLPRSPEHEEHILARSHRSWLSPMHVDEHPSR